MKKIAVMIGIALLLLLGVAAASANAGRPHRHLRGEVASLDASASTVSFFARDQTTKTLIVDAKTRIRKNGHLVGFDRLALADRGHAKYINDNGTLKALKIFVHTPFMIGRLTDITSDTVTLTQPRGALRTFNIDADTKIRRGGVDIPLADVNIGDRAKIYYNKLESGEFVARRIRVAAANN